jgi:hypothetical protein
MMSLRFPDFQLFLTLAEAAARHGSGVKGPVSAAAERMFTALRTPSAQAGLRAPLDCRSAAIWRQRLTMRAVNQARSAPWPMLLASSNRSSTGRSELAP